MRAAQSRHPLIVTSRSRPVADNRARRKSATQYRS
ncbi:hypothetical protein EI534_01540 [Pseudomonas frederiksbergensis]|nr:hypothetical protein [Pseudomonas frederiksbergensis]